MLRDYGISHCSPHSILLTQTRSCPLLPPPPAEKIPAWKTVRPRKKPEDDRAEESRKFVHVVDMLFFCKCIVVRVSENHYFFFFIAAGDW